MADLRPTNLQENMFIPNQGKSEKGEQKVTAYPVWLLGPLYTRIHSNWPTVYNNNRQQKSINKCKIISNFKYLQGGIKINVIFLWFSLKVKLNNLIVKLG